MNGKLEAAFARLAHPSTPTQYDIELAKAIAMIVQADALERIAAANEKQVQPVENLKEKPSRSDQRYPGGW